MIQITPPQNPGYWINQRALTFSENDLDNPNRVAVSLVSGTVIMAYVKDMEGLGLAADGNYQKWTLKGYSTKLIKNDAHYVYARLSRTEKDALIVFSVNNYNIDGSITTTDADGNATTSAASEAYFYIKIGELTATDGTTDRKLTYDSGQLGTQGYAEAETELDEMFELSKTSSPWLIFVKQMFYEFSVKGFINMLSGFILGDKKITDIKRSTDSDEDVPIDDESIPTTKYVNELGDKKYIRKDKDDQTPYMLSTLGGLLVKPWVKFGEFITGIQGGYIDEKGDAELNSLVLRDHLSVPEIRFNRMTYFEGYNLISPGGGFNILEVADNEDGTYTVTPELEEGEPCGQYVDDILLGYWHDKTATGDFAGFKKVQFRVVSVDYTEKTCVLMPRPDTDAVPLRNMRLGQTGNFTNTERQTYIIIDTRDGNNCITYMDNANTWDPEPAQMKSWFGKKKGMTVQGIDCDNYSAVLQNLLFTGTMFQTDEITGDTYRVPINKGEWVSGDTYGYYDEVTHGGSLWLCVNPDGSISEPAADNSDWLLMVAKGAGMTSSGEWSAAKVPYAANTMVSFGGGFFVSKVETSLPPIAVWQLADGTYAQTNSGAYAMIGGWEDAGNSEEWDLLIAPGSLNGTSMLFQGSYAVAPENPEEGWCYYNTTDKCSYVYRSGRWMVMAQDGVDGQDGKDGKDFEWVFIRTTTDEKPAQPYSNPDEDDYVPPEWTDDPVGPTEELPYEWTCKRVKQDGVWGDFSYVALWTKYGFDGVDGKDGKDGKDGTSMVAIGAWNESILPVSAGSVVTFAGGSYVATVDTSIPPIAVYLLSDGKYARTAAGAYALMGSWETHGNTSDWQLVAADGNPGVSYWLDIPISAISFTSTGTPSPSAWLATMKMSVGQVVRTTSDFFLTVRRLKGAEWSAQGTPTQAASISVASTAGYSQFVVRAYKTAADGNSWNDNYVAERGVSVVTDGAMGATGAMPIDCGKWTSGKTYVWNADRRDKIIHPFAGVYYNFLVKNYGSSVTAAPTSATGDTNWEAMSKLENIATDTLFADKANVAQFMFYNSRMISQEGTLDGVSKNVSELSDTQLASFVPNTILDGKTGYFKCNNIEVAGSVVGPLSIGEGFTINGESSVDQGIYYKDSNTSDDKYGTLSFRPRGVTTVARNTLTATNNTSLNVLMYLERARNNTLDRALYAHGISEFNGRVAISSINATDTTAKASKPALFVEGGIGMYGSFHCEPTVLTSGSYIQGDWFNSLYNLKATGKVTVDIQNWYAAEDVKPGSFMTIVNETSNAWVLSCATGGFYYGGSNMISREFGGYSMVTLTKTSTGLIIVRD